MQNLESLYQTLFQRKRPEDVADMILSILKDGLSKRERYILEKAARGALKRKIFNYTSMLQEFAKPVGAEKQIQTAIEVFKVKGFKKSDYTDPKRIEAFLDQTSGLIHKNMGSNDFMYDRLNRMERKAVGLDISRRQYNKKWRQP